MTPGHVLSTLIAIAFFTALGVAYIAPSIVAYIRHVRDLGAVLVINLFLGWTFLGWVVALAMALRTSQTPPTSIIQTGTEGTPSDYGQRGY